MIEQVYQFGRNGITMLLYFAKIKPGDLRGFVGEVYEFASGPKVLEKYQNTHERVLLEIVKEALIEKNKGMELISVENFEGPAEAAKCVVRFHGKEMDDGGILPRENFKYFVIASLTRQKFLQ